MAHTKFSCKSCGTVLLGLGDTDEGPCPVCGELVKMPSYKKASEVPEVQNISREIIATSYAKKVPFYKRFHFDEDGAKMMKLIYAVLVAAIVMAIILKGMKKRHFSKTKIPDQIKKVNVLPAREKVKNDMQAPDY